MSSLLWSLVLFRLFLSSFGWDRNWERNIFSNFHLKRIYLDLRSRKIIFAKKINKFFKLLLYGSKKILLKLNEHEIQVSVLRGTISISTKITQLKT